MNAFAPVRYLDIRGVLRADMSYRPQPGFESERMPRPRLEPEPATCAGDARSVSGVIAVALDENDAPLVQAPVDLVVRGCGSTDHGSRRLRAALPLPPRAVAYELRCGAIRIHRAAIAARAPRISRIEARGRGRRLTLSWRTDHALPVTWNVVFASEDGGGRVTLARGLVKPEVAIDFERTPVYGRGRLEIVATDGVRSARLRGPRHEGIARAAMLHIASPADGTTLAAGQPVSLIAVCLDPLGAVATPGRVEWRIDGHSIDDHALLAAATGVASGVHAVEVVATLGREELRATGRFRIARPTAGEREWHVLVAALDALPRAGGGAAPA